MSLSGGRDRVLEAVIGLFGDFGTAVADPTDIIRTVLVRDGHYCGHAFDFGGLRAVWFADADQIKLYRAGSSLLRAVRLESRAVRAAA
jgi:hypothetical protein